MFPSVNTYNGSTAAMTLLSPTVSWAQVRADRDRQLQFQAAIAQDAQQKKAQSQEAAAATQQAVSALYDVPFLEQDQLRWKDAVDGMLAENEKRIKTDYAGDHERYGQERYQQDTQNLISRTLKHPLFKSALKRRSDAVQLMADQSKGLIDRPVTYRLLDGTMKTAPATENYRDFQTGKTEDFQYQGGYQAPTKWNDFFSKNYHPKSATDPNGKFKPYKATADEVMGAMLSEDGMNVGDATDYLTRFGSRLNSPTWKFDARDPYREAALKNQQRSLAQGDVRNRIAQQNANTAASKLKLDKQMATGFNAYGTSLDPRNITTTDAQGTPAAIPATVYNNGKAEGSPWALVGYDSQLIQPHVLGQLGIKEQKTKEGTRLTPGQLGEVLVMAPNPAGGADLRKTDLSGLKYQVVGAGDFFRRNLSDREKTTYERNGGTEKIYQQLTIRLTANDAIKAKSNPLFKNIVGSKNATGSFLGMTSNVDTEVGAGAYKVAGKDANGQTYYDFTVIKAVPLTAATRALIEGAPTGKWMDSKAGGSSMSDYNNEGAGPSYNLFDDIDN